MSKNRDIATILGRTETSNTTNIALGSLIGTQIFTSSGTYTPATNATKAIVHVVGAGGAGGGTAGTSTGEGAAAGGGAGGGIIISDVIDVSGSSYTSTITIGVGGTGANNTDGTAGGNTTYADGTITLTASGGLGASAETNRAIFRVTAGGQNQSNNTVTGHTPISNITSRGGGTGMTFVDADVSNMVVSGFGGDAFPYGRGGMNRQRSTTGTSNGADGDGYGGGGSGANSHSNADDKAGGNGADGVVIIFEYL